MSACRHKWSDDYVCTECGHIRYASVPLWALIVKMKSGPRQVWLALWTFADHEAMPLPIWPSNAAIRERSGGISESTLREHLAALRSMGWIRDHGDGRRSIELAWLAPYPTESRRSPTESRCLPPESRGAGIPLPPAGIPLVTAGIPLVDRRNSGPVPTMTNQRPTNDQPTNATPADAVIDAVLVERHREIEAQQAKLRADREATRAEIAATDPRRALTPEHIAAVREAGPLWAVELERDKWATQFGEAVRELALEPAAVSALLAAWGVAAARLAEEAGTTVGLATAKLPRFAGPLPPRIGIWWPSWRAWVAEQLAPTTTRVEAGNGKSSTPLSCRAPENTPEIVTFDAEAARARTAERRRQREAQAANGVRP